MKTVSIDHKSTTGGGEMSRLKVFLSHSTGDKPLARKIGAALNREDIKVWLDEVDIRVGQSIPEEVANGLSDSGAICLLFSKAAASSTWVKREFNSFLHQAMGDGRVILPCKLDDTPLPTLIRDIKYANFSKSFKDGISGILSAIKVGEEVALRKEVNKKKRLVRSFLKRRSESPPLDQLEEIQSFRSIDRMRGSDRQFAEDFVKTCNIDTDYNNRIQLRGPLRIAVIELVADFTAKKVAR